ncbi:MAG: cyclomaltodextrinase N-terminal domain-containing protein [Bryobacterales bacterium]|nr:cyclomaltodextrinase N-terminal domain-containing protein [Bryobacterales bacterium]
MRTVIALFVLGGLMGAAPRVEKIEPPSWWLGGVWSPVRVLVRGAELQGATVSVAAPLKISGVKVNERGTYLFADVVIPKSAKAGAYRITVKTAAGTAETSFEVLPKLAAAQRFQGFGSDDVMYLIMPDRFANGDASNDDAGAKGLLDRRKPRYYHGGDFQGILDRAGYLNELGVTALWLNPWYDNVDHLNTKETYGGQAITDYHGYGAVDYYGVESRFGDLALLRKMTAELQQKGVKMIQDQVANHTGPFHPWVQDAPTATWYNGTAQKHLANDWQTWTLMDPHATVETRRTTLDGWFIDILPDMNQGDAEARRYLIQNSLWWVGVAGLDGIRQDTLPYAPRDYWRDWMTALHAEFPRAKAVGEVLDGDPAFVAFFQGGAKRFDGIDTGVDAMFDFPLMYGMRKTFAEGKTVKEVARVMAHDHLYPDTSMLVTFLGLHDVTRFMNEPGATVAGMKLAYTFLLTTRGIPMIYYGDEIAMPGGNDPDNRRDFPGGWKEDARNAFTSAGRTADENELFEHVKKLIALRKGSAALRRGGTENLMVGEQQWVYARTMLGATVLVVLNNAGAEAEVVAPMPPMLRGKWTDRAGGLGTVEVGEVLRVKLGARSGAVLTR